jgi:O-antigen ligase
MLKAIVLLCAASTIGALLVSPYVGWQVAFIAKPLVDIGWTPEYFVLGLSPLEIVGAALPAILLARAAVLRGEFPRSMPLRIPWMLYMGSVLMGCVLFAFNGELVSAASFGLRALNGFVAYYSMARWFADRERFRVLLIAMLIAGIVPMAMGFYESATGNYWRLRGGAGDQIRITGLYHNSTNLRYYAYAALTAIALYWVYFARRTRLNKLLLLGYAAVCAVVLFKVYSKAGFITIAFAAMAWVVIGRNYLWPALLVIAMLVVNVTLDDVVTRELQTTFAKETRVVEEGQLHATAFGGRFGMWQQQWIEWSEQDALSRLFGSGDKGGGRGARGGGHNDYIRALMQTGLVGALAYIALLVATGVALVRRMLRNRTPLVLVATVVYVGWLVETIGFTPAVYTNFQWFTWSFIGLALVGVRGLEEQVRPIDAPAGSRRRRRGNFVDAGRPGLAAAGRSP